MKITLKILITYNSIIPRTQVWAQALNLPYLYGSVPLNIYNFFISFHVFYYTLLKSIQWCK